MIVCVGTFTEVVQRFLNWNEKSRGAVILKKIYGGLVLLDGLRLMGFGADSRMPTAKTLRLSEDLPIVIEIVDKPEKIQEILLEIDKMIQEGKVAIERINVIAYRQNSNKP